MVRMIIVFLLGMLAGAVGIMVLCVLIVDYMELKRSKELTKEEWKAGLRKK